MYRYGDDVIEASLLPHRRDNIPTGLEESGVKEELEPFYQIISRDKDGRPNKVSLIGFIKEDPDGHEVLMSTDKKPIALLEHQATIGFWDKQSDKYIYKILLNGYSLTSKFFGVSASKALADELHALIMQFKPTTQAGRQAKLLLSHRWLQMRLALGEPLNFKIDPVKCRLISEELSKLSVEELGNISQPRVRNLLWQALANAHPYYTLLWEAVRYLGEIEGSNLWEDKPETLKSVLSRFQDCFDTYDVDKDNNLHFCDMNLETKNMLIKMLDFNSLTTLEEIEDFFRYFIVEIDILDNRWVSSFSDVAREKSKYIKRFEHIVLKAFVLQRAGYDVELIFSKQKKMTQQKLDSETKTLVDDNAWFLVRDKDNPNRRYAIELSRNLHGRDVQGTDRQMITGPIELTQEDIQVLQAEYSQATVFPMRSCPACSWSVLPYTQVYEQVIGNKLRERGSERESLRADAEDMRIGDIGVIVEVSNEHEILFWPFVELLELSDKESRQVDSIMAQRFEQVMRSHGIPVVEEPGIDYDELIRRKAEFARAFDVMPTKFLRRLRRFTIQKEVDKERSVEPVVKDGKVQMKPGDYEYAGRYLSSEEEVKAKEDADTALHELLHHWDLAITDELKDLYGDVSEIFYDISWIKDRYGNWRLRSEMVNMEHFSKEHALLDPGEDLAGAGTHYCMEGIKVRLNASNAMIKGDFVPAVKYLFCKYLMFLDSDGLAIEYSVGRNSEPIAFEEVLQAMDNCLDRSQHYGLSVEDIREIKRLRAIVLDIQKVWQKERQTGRIVQAETGYKAEGLPQDAARAAAGGEPEPAEAAAEPPEAAGAGRMEAAANAAPQEENRTAPILAGEIQYNKELIKYVAKDELNMILERLDELRDDSSSEEERKALEDVKEAGFHILVITDRNVSEVKPIVEAALAEGAFQSPNGKAITLQNIYFYPLPEGLTEEQLKKAIQQRAKEADAVIINVDGLGLRKDIRAIASVLGMPTAVVSSSDKNGWIEALESI